MQKLSELIGENQFCVLKFICRDCGMKKEIILERVSPDQIEIKSGGVYRDKKTNEYSAKCDECFSRNQSIGPKVEVYSRVVGYLTPVSGWNDGKQEEFKDRKTFKQSSDGVDGHHQDSPFRGGSDAF